MKIIKIFLYYLHEFNRHLAFYIACGLHRAEFYFCLISLDIVHPLEYSRFSASLYSMLFRPFRIRLSCLHIASESDLVETCFFCFTLHMVTHFRILIFTAFTLLQACRESIYFLFLDYMCLALCRTKLCFFQIACD